MPGHAGTAEATGCGSSARPWRSDASEPVDQCRPHNLYQGWCLDGDAGEPGLGHDQDQGRRQDEQERELKGGENMRMTKMMLVAMTLMVSAQTAMSSNAKAQVLTGDARLACEALVCLSAVGSPPGECSKALAKYEAMKAQLWFNPLAVYNFLKGCPKQ